MKLFKVCAYECRDTYVTAEDVSEAIEKSGVNKDSVNMVRVLASDIPMNKKGPLLVVTSFDNGAIT